MKLKSRKFVGECRKIVEMCVRFPALPAPLENPAASAGVVWTHG